MSKTECETIRQAAMALEDGETAPWSAGQVQAHLVACPACARAVKELGSLGRLLDKQSHREQPVHLWPRIEGRIASHAAAHASLKQARLLVALVIALLCFRGIALGASEPLIWLARLAALVFLGGWFFLLRENPFAIHPQLVETKETKP